MFELVLIHQSEEKAGDMQQAWEQPGVRLRAYDAWAMDPEALDDCRQALGACRGSRIFRSFLQRFLRAAGSFSIRRSKKRIS